MDFNKLQFLIDKLSYLRDTNSYSNIFCLRETPHFACIAKDLKMLAQKT